MLKDQFRKIKAAKKIGLMTHLVLGYPSFEENIETVELMQRCGVDFVELQLPFSDPVADGPTMMAANTKSLLQGTKIKDCFAAAKEINTLATIPTLFMTYINIAYQHGLKRFVEDSTKVGMSGIILPDLPFEESDEYVQACRKKNIDPIFVVSPNSGDSRLKRMKSLASGFVYCTTRTGVTGVQKELPTETKVYLQRVKKIFNLPLAVGFGIASQHHVGALQGIADCAIIGSAIMELVHQGKTKKERLSLIEKFLLSLR